MLTWSTVGEHVRAGRLVALAVTSGRRLPQVPDVPTLKELGHADFVATAWYSLSAPAGLSPDIVAAANREVVKAMDRPQMKRQIEQDAIETQAMSPAELARFMQSEIDRWTPMIKQLLGAKERWADLSLLSRRPNGSLTAPRHSVCSLSPIWGEGWGEGATELSIDLKSLTPPARSQWERDCRPPH